MSKASDYAARFNQVFDYIDDHIEDDLSLATLSKIAHFSKYHFHRQFSEYTGISLFKYVQLLRLKRASYRLVFNQNDKIIDIALDAYFENPESFSRAFKSTFGQTPTEFRQKPAWQPWKERYTFPTRERTTNMQVNIVNFTETKVAYLRHNGSPKLVNDTISQFIAWRKDSGLSPINTSQSFGIIYDNPETVAPEKFRFDLCGEVTADIPPNPQGVLNSVIPTGRCAVVRHTGSHDRLSESVYPLYRDWLPESGEELRDFPLFFSYLNFFPETPEAELQTDIYLPLK